jgi:hypothetical protein
VEFEDEFGKLNKTLDRFIAQEESGGIVAWQHNGRSHSVRDHWFAKIPMVLGYPHSWTSIFILYTS